MDFHKDTRRIWPVEAKRHGRVTATEKINNLLYRMVLEQDSLGDYRVVLVEPCAKRIGSRISAMPKVFFRR